MKLRLKELYFSLDYGKTMPHTHKIDMGNKVTKVSELVLQNNRRTSDKRAACWQFLHSPDQTLCSSIWMSPTPATHTMLVQATTYVQPMSHSDASHVGLDGAQAAGGGGLRFWGTWILPELIKEVTLSNLWSIGGKEEKKKRTRPELTWGLSWLPQGWTMGISKKLHFNLDCHQMVEEPCSSLSLQLGCLESSEHKTHCSWHGWPIRTGLSLTWQRLYFLPLKISHPKTEGVSPINLWVEVYFLSFQTF